MDDQREMFAELNALLAAIAKAFELQADDAVRAIEASQIALAMEEDDSGHKYVAATYQGRQVRIYEGAIKHAAEEPAEDCGHEGCGCAT